MALKVSWFPTTLPSRISSDKLPMRTVPISAVPDDWNCRTTGGSPFFHVVHLPVMSDPSASSDAPIRATRTMMSFFISISPPHLYRRPRPNRNMTSQHRRRSDALGSYGSADPNLVLAVIRKVDHSES